MEITIGRTSGPVTDVCCQSEFEATDLDIILDVIAIVNKVSGNKEKWFVRIAAENGVISHIPKIN